jgi:hypothetical protein
MTTVTVGEAVQACLGKLAEPVELRSPDGTLLGYFTPMTEAAARRYESAKGRFDPEVIRQRGASNADPCLTTAEVVRHIESQDTAQ